MVKPAKKMHSCTKCAFVTEHVFSFRRHQKKCAGARHAPAVGPDSLTPEGKFRCLNCKFEYKQKTSLYRHIKLCPVRPLCATENLRSGTTNTESTGEANPDATTIVRRRTSRKKRSVNVPNTKSGSSCEEESGECSGTKVPKRQARIPCFSDGCDRIFLRYDSLLRHVQLEHSDEPQLIEKILGQYESLTFENFGSFLKWKEEVEISTHTYFSKHTGKNRYVFGEEAYTYSYYVCQHDGSDKPHRPAGQGMKTSRKQKIGRAKLGNTCVARMCVKQGNTTGIVKVKYFSAHQHSPSYEDTIHHPIPDSKREFIKEQLRIGIPVRDIYSALTKNAGDRKRNADGELLHKGDIVSLSVIRSIAKTLKSQARLYPDDAAAVLSLVNKLQEETYDPVLVYKPQGGGVVVGDPGINELEDQDNLFMLGFQTEPQLDVLKRSSFACMDWTHKTNQYNFQLFTIVVQNECSGGYPVAHFICNRIDAEVLHFFFDALKSRCLTLDLNQIITDDDPTIWNAFVSGFVNLDLDTQNDELGQIGAKHFLCHWHVHRNWMRSLRQMVSDMSLEQEMYTALRVILYCKDVTEFEELSVEFCEKYRHSAPTFVTYFESCYLNRAESWASCFRNFTHGNCNTNMLVESFHNRLKTLYVKHKLIKRLDDLINMLLDIEKEYHCRGKGTLAPDTPTIKNCLPKEDRHRRGIRIPNDHVISCGSSKWEVTSQSTPGLMHTVTEVSGYDCSKDICYERCLEITCAGLCQHSYTCSCSDYSPMCKHIHKVHSFEMSKFAASGEDDRFESADDRGESADDCDESVDAEMVTFFHDYALVEPEELVIEARESGVDSSQIDDKIILDRIVNNIGKLKKHLNSKQATRSSLTHIDEIIGNLALKYGAAEETCSPVKMVKPQIPIDDLGLQTLDVSVPTRKESVNIETIASRDETEAQKSCLQFYVMINEDNRKVAKLVQIHQ